MVHFYVYQDPPERCLCFLLDLGFPFFTRLRNPDLWCWLYDMCFCWFRFDCWKLKVSQFQAFVQLQMWPNRSWSPSWVRWGAVLRLPVGGGCCGWGCCVSTQAIRAGETPEESRNSSVFGNMRLSHLSKTCPWKNDLGWHDLPWAEPWWNLRKGFKHQRYSRLYLDLPWFSCRFVWTFSCLARLVSRVKLYPPALAWIVKARLFFFGVTQMSQRQEVFLMDLAYSDNWFWKLAFIYFIGSLPKMACLYDPTLCDGQVSPMSGTMPCRGIASC